MICKMLLFVTSKRIHVILVIIVDVIFYKSTSCREVCVYYWFIEVQV
jgi:hypothetical protein